MFMYNFILRLKQKLLHSKGRSKWMLKKTDCLVRDWLMEQVSECRPFLLLLWWAMHSLPGFHRLLSTVLMLTIHDWTIVFLGIWCTFVVYLLTTSVCQHLITSHRLSPPISLQPYRHTSQPKTSCSQQYQLFDQFSPRDECTAFVLFRWTGLRWLVFPGLCSFCTEH